MREPIRLRIWLPAALFAWAIFGAGCVQPLGPGFRFVDRQTEIHAVPDGLHVRVTDRLDNAGDRPLHLLDARLPEGTTSGSRSLHITIAGKEVSPQSASNADPRLVSAPFDSAWEQRQPREIVTEWDMTPDPAGRGAVAASAMAFYIADRTALPLWQPPYGVFAKGNSHPEEEVLDIFAPPDFRVMASGKQLGGKTEGGLIAHRFHNQKGEDFVPFVVAGRYQEQIIHTGQGLVNFWTFQPLDAQRAQMAAVPLASFFAALTDFFGPASKGKNVVRIVEAPGELPAKFGAPESPGGASFPGGALLDPRAFAQGISSEAVLELAEYELTQTWFGWRVQPSPEARILMDSGLGLFASILSAEVRGPDERRKSVTALVAHYDEALRAGLDKPLLEPPAGYSRAEDITTSYKAALFLVALEDVCGHDNLRTAFREISRAREGSDVGGEDLRAAAEAASHRDLAEMFRTWFNRAGIPDDFRAHYGNP